MSDEETDLYYDAISTGPSTTSDPSSSTQSNVSLSATLGTTNHHNVTRTEKYKTCKLDIDHDKLTPRGCDPEVSAQIDSSTKQAELHGSRRAPGGNKVLQNIAKFEAVKHDSDAGRSSPGRDKSQSPVQDGNIADRGQKVVDDIAQKTQFTEHDTDEGWNQWEAGNAAIGAHITQGNDTTDAVTDTLAESRDTIETDDGGWQAWGVVHTDITDNETSAIYRDPDQSNTRQGVYSFAQPFPVDSATAVSKVDTNVSHFENQNNAQGWVSPDKRALEDSFGYSHAKNLPGDFGTAKPDNKPPEIPPGRPEVFSDTNTPPGPALIDIDAPVPTAHEDFEQTIYDSVCSDSSGKTLDRSGAAELDAKLDAIAGIDRSSPDQPQEKQFGSHNWSRKAKLRSRALRRSHKNKDSNPFSGHHEFQNPAKGAVPEAEDEDFMEVLSPFNMSYSSGSSYFTDSSFDSPISDFSDDEKEVSTMSYSNKPLPPVPNKKKEEDGRVLEQVKLRRPRDAPSLPDAPDGLNPTQKKLRGVLQSLIDNERNYISSLQRLVDEYKNTIINQYISRSKEVKITFKSVEEILIVHKMFEIELAEKLKNWYTEENIGVIFHMFSKQMVIEFYSTYVNIFESTCETIKDTENSRQAFKDFLKNKQMSSSDRLSLAGLMLKPVQRFPQLIMIIKDLLKYTPRDHHDREPLQEALTGLENVAHQLNERKRHTEQYYLGQQIISRLPPRIHMEKHTYLIRQDDMEQLSQDSTGGHIVKQRRLFLMNDKIISVHVTQRDQDGPERFTYKWHQSLKELELTTSAITPNMHTRVQNEVKNTTIFSPKPDAHYDEDPYSVASELTDMMHDVTILGQICQMVSTLKRSYTGVTEDQLQEHMTGLQKEIQGKDYQLQMLNSSSIILQDKLRKKKYVFSAATANIKQEWCTDFLMAKYALDAVNMPSWFEQDRKETGLNQQPALLTRHLSVDMQRTFTKVKCGVRVYFPTKNEGSVEHLWVCSSTLSVGQVSIVALHTAKPSLVESFQATKCDIVCVEMVPGFALVESELAFPEDCVWMSTVESEIVVFQFSDQKDDAHRQPVHRFLPGCIIICMTYMDDKVFCGSRGGVALVYSRNDDGIWYGPEHVQLGAGSVTSIICVGNSMWAACGNNIYIIDPETCKVTETVSHQMGDQDYAVQYLVKAGVGVWVSFHNKPNIVLYHSESKRMLQDFNISSSIREFINAHTGEKQSSLHYEVTNLMVSLGLLWVGTNLGIILTYPLPRLRDGVPRIHQRPHVALHGHNGPIRFLVPVHYGPVSAVPIRRRPSSILKRNDVEKVAVAKLPKLQERYSSEHDNIYVSLDAEAMQTDAFENLYEPVMFHGEAGSHANTDMKTDSDKSATPTPTRQLSEDSQYYQLCQQTQEYLPMNFAPSDHEVEFAKEPKYFILEPQTKQFIPVNSVSQKTKGDSSKQSSEHAQSPITAESNKTAEHDEEDSEYIEIPDLRSKHLKDNMSLDRPYSASHVTDSPLKTDDVILRDKTGRRSGSPKTLFEDTPANQSKSPNTKPVNPHGLLIDTAIANQFDTTNTKPVKLPGIINQPVMPIAFRSELKNKLKNRQSQENLTDLAVTKDGMGRLYETLMRPSRDTKRDSDLCASLPSNYSFEASYLEQSYIRPRTTVAISSRKPDITATRFNSSKKAGKQQDSKNAASQNKVRNSTPVSFSANQSKPSMGSSFSSGVDTLRKQNSNTILVLSGGDGYKDWKKRQNPQSYRPEEPCLIFWMYKF